MLLGNYNSKLDQAKGRTALPKKFRVAMGKKIIITMGYENSLMLISYKNWEKVTESIINRPFISQPARQTDRFLLGNAYELELDDQGRFIIPPALRRHAKLGSDIVFVGMGNRVEIWDQDQWRLELKHLQAHINQITAKLTDPDASQ